MASKIDFKQLLIEKGEKIGLGVGAAVMVLLIIVGIMSATGAESSGKTAESLSKKAQEVTTQLQNGPSGEPTPVNPELINKVPTFDPYAPLAFATRNDLFDRTAASTAKRMNPRILGVTEYQVDLVRSTVEIIDVIDVQGTPKVGIVTTKDLPDNEAKRLRKSKDSRLQKLLEERRKMMAAMGGMGGPPGMGAPGMGAPGGAGGDGRGGPGGRGGPPPGMMMGGPGGFNVNAQRGGAIEQVEYVPIDDKRLEDGSASLALTLYPVRMAVVHAAFPYKEQLKEFQKALRYASLEDMLADGNFKMQFAGFAVQRRRLHLDGKPVKNEEGQDEGWQDFDWMDAAATILLRRVADYDPIEKNRDLVFVTPPPDEMLAIPLPLLRGNVEYPAVQLKAIKDTIEAIKKAQAAANPKQMSELQQKLQEGMKDRAGLFRPMGGTPGMGRAGGSGGGPAGDNPVSPGGGKPGGGKPGTGQPGGSDTRGGSGGGPAGDNPTRPGQGGPGMGYGNPGQLYGQTPETIPDYWLIRFIDPTVEPGYKYEYRVQVHVQNPNYVPKDQRKGNWAGHVIHPMLAEAEELDPKPWTDKDMVASGPLPVTAESLMYVISDTPVSTDPTKVQYYSEQVQLELQSWKREVPLAAGDTRNEPVGAWVVSPVMRTQRGEYIGKTQQVRLPLWSSSQMDFVIREGLRQRPQPGQPPRQGGGGVAVDFGTRSVLLDFEGGHQTTTFPGRGPVTEEELGVSALILTDDGRLVVRNSGIDKNDADRKKREQAWKAWVSEVESKQKQRDAGSGDRLGAPGGGPGGGGKQ